MCPSPRVSSCPPTWPDDGQKTVSEQRYRPPVRGQDTTTRLRFAAVKPATVRGGPGTHHEHCGDKGETHGASCIPSPISIPSHLIPPLPSTVYASPSCVRVRRARKRGERACAPAPASALPATRRIPTSDRCWQARLVVLVGAQRVWARWVPSLAHLASLASRPADLSSGGVRPNLAALARTLTTLTLPQSPGMVFQASMPTTYLGTYGTHMCHITREPDNCFR